VTHEIVVNMDKKCAECRKGGAVQSGICLGCTAKAMDLKRKMKSETGRAVQERFRRMKQQIRSTP
jgi:hypothetical protein